MLDVYIRATQTVEDELDTQLDPVEGQLPTGLRGLLYRNGPGRHEICGHRYGHPFDGDGMILRLELSDTGIHYRNRYVRTRELTEELRAGRPLYRSFGTNLPGGLARNALRLRFKNAANTGVIEFGGKLLALWEGGLPHALDKDTLATLGRYDFQGRLRNTFSPLERMLNTELPFSAHPRICPETGVLYNFGTANGFKPRLMLYQVQPDGRMAAPGHITLKALSFVHDFVLTPNYLVFFLPSVVFDVPRALSGLATPVDTLHGSGKPTRVIAVSRDDFRVVGSWLTEPGFIFHFSNGFQAGDDIVVDGLRLEDLPSAAQVREIIEGRASMYPSPRWCAQRSVWVCNRPTAKSCSPPPGICRRSTRVSTLETIGSSGPRRPRANATTPSRPRSYAWTCLGVRSNGGTSARISSASHSSCPTHTTGKRAPAGS